MKGPLAEIVATLSHLPGVVAAMIVGAADGLIVETSPMKGAAAGGADPRHHHRRWHGRQHHPGEDGRPLHDPQH